MVTSIELALAGLWSYVVSWGLAVALLVGLLAAALFTTAIPVIGPYLKDMRAHLLWAAFGVCLYIGGMYSGGAAEKRRGVAKQVVIEKTVTNAVTKTDSLKYRKMQDRWDKSEY